MSELIPQAVRASLRHIYATGGNLVVITGAGISAESGVPTFRGQEGYWTIGSREYQPQAIGTWAMFQRCPEDVWAWYLYRRGICANAEPNLGHQALVDLEARFRGRFRLVTQNVDGLHLRAGNTEPRTYRIHGDLGYVRCFAACSEKVWRIDDAIALDRTRNSKLTDDDRDRLRCPDCGAWVRPHILWFDESYNELHYRYDSSLAAATHAQALLVVGTSGATNLPLQMGRFASETGAFIIDVNMEANPFSRMAESTGGVFLRGSSSELLPAIAELFPE